ERDTSRSPLFQVMFVLQNAPMSSLELPELTIKQLERESRTTKFDLTISMMESKQGLIGEIEYNSDLFEAATIARMIEHYQVLLENIVTNPSTPINELAIMSSAERAEILIEWNKTAVEYQSDKCIHHLIEEQVASTPEAIAVVYQEQELNYRELNSRAN